MVYDAIIAPLTGFHPTIAVLIFGLIILILINVFYKLLINQPEAKRIKDRQKELNKQVSEYRKQGDMANMNKLMKEVMRENTKLMKMTMKPMMVSFIIVIVLLPALHAAYSDIFVGIDGGTGSLNYLGETYDVSVSGQAVTISGASCQAPCETVVGSTEMIVTLEDSSVKLAPIVARSPISIPLTGYELGWLAWYIMLSIPLAITIRKFMKIYV